MGKNHAKKNKKAPFAQRKKESGCKVAEKQEKRS